MTQQSFRFFIAGIIQGSHLKEDVSSQSYRAYIRSLLEDVFPASRIYCPVENHPDSVNYSDEEARATFMKHVDLVKQSDAIIVYVPEASMGSAIEMWEACHHQTLVIVITPMQTNWVIRLFSDYVLNDLNGFEFFVKSGVLSDMLNARNQKRRGKAAS